MAEKSITLEFELAQKEILNSNSIPSHFIVKGKMVSYLRELSATVGLLHHPEEVQPLVEEKLRWLKAAQAQQLRKNRLKKRLLKDSSLSEADVLSEIQAAFPEEEKPVFAIPHLFEQFTVMLHVFPPTRRRVDPPNLWPSLKALSDGLTDAAWWEDDDFGHMLETSFRYGGLSGLKGKWRFELVVTEVSDTSEFQLVAEAPNAS